MGVILFLGVWLILSGYRLIPDIWTSSWWAVSIGLVLLCSVAHHIYDLWRRK